MSVSLEQASIDYVAMRRSFGYKLHGHDRLLTDFCAYLTRVGLNSVTVETAAAWAVAPGRSDAWHSERLTVVRGFAAYLRGLDHLRTGGEPDERVRDAVRHLRDKRQPDGTWLLENTHPGQTHYELEDGDGRPSRWNTLRALRVLDWYDRHQRGA